MARAFLLATAAALVAATGCKKANEDYCCTSAACAEERGCPDGMVCDNEGERGGLANSCVEVAGETCGPDDPCGDGAPICHQGVCVECEESSDCGAGAPVCDPGALSCDGCVDADDCAAYADAPVCGDEGACRVCLAGDECASGVCDTAAGGCVAADDVLYVETGGDGDGCTAEDPCGAIQQAIDLADGQRVWILVAPGSYAETLSVVGTTARILADGADLVPGGAVMSAVIVRGAANLVIEGLRIHDASGTGTSGDGVNCANDVDSPLVVLRRVIIEDNADEGVDANVCTIEITRSTLRHNDGRALSLEDTDFVVIDNFMYENGGADQPGGVTVRGNPPGGADSARLEHNTIVRNSAPDGTVAGITCADVTAGLTFRNNLVHANDAAAPAEVVGANCVHEYSLIGPIEAAGANNVNDAPTYVDQAGDDYRLDRGSAGIDAAAPSDVDIDHEGDERPFGDGPDIGADESLQ